MSQILLDLWIVRSEKFFGFGVELLALLVRTVVLVVAVIVVKAVFEILLVVIKVEIVVFIIVV